MGTTSKYLSTQQCKRDVQAFGQNGQTSQSQDGPLATGIKAHFHPQSCSDNKLSSTLPAQVQQHASVGAGLLGKGQSSPCSTRISAQHEYVIRKERKTTRIRTELEWGTSSPSGNSNIAFPKTAKASPATYVSGPCLYFVPAILASCCKTA